MIENIPANSPNNNSASIIQPNNFASRYIKGLGRFLKGNYLNWLAVTLVGLMVFLAIFGDLITPYPPSDMDLSVRLSPPSPIHPFGTDDYGRDLLSRVIGGARISLEIAALVLVIASFLGFLLGSLAGLLGGLVDEIIMRITDLFLAFPGLILAMAIAATLGANLQNVMIALSMVYWPWYARMIRGLVLSLREREYMLAATCLGAGTPRLIFSHLLPNVAPILITQISLDVGFVILSTSSLSFLGLGAQPPTPEWGAILTSARLFIREAWWMSTFPGLALALTVLGFNILGDGLRDHLDPRIRKA
jgi:peptide/nickel transport system permease protein